MKILFISLGCDKNLVDSEVMLTLLADKGHQMVSTEEEAEAIVINTCCFIHDAKKESIDTIIEMARLKEEGLKYLVVTGCLAQRYAEEIEEEIPEVDGLLGTASYDEIVDLLEDLEAGKRSMRVKEPTGLPNTPTKRLITTGGHFAYLKIAEGCDKHCTYCIIPALRGAYRSVPMEKLVEEAKMLVEAGAKELILVAQETTLYGVDLYGEKSLDKLLRELVKIEELEWIRLLYCYPEEITDELVQTIKSEKKICNYLDIPIQHISDDILRRMGRKTRKEELTHIITTLRREIPDIALRTTFISGFPGESQENHEELFEFINEMEFDRLGVFTYSPEEGTPASVMPDQISEKNKKERQADLMELQRDIAFFKAQELIGSILHVMIEGKVEDENVYIGRTYMDAPDVDGLIFIQSDKELMSGDFVIAKVTGAKDYDLIGEEIYEFTE